MDLVDDHDIRGATSSVVQATWRTRVMRSSPVLNCATVAQARRKPLVDLLGRQAAKSGPP
ncbi:MAG: hypothetical protein U0869_17165 [Chloroflexota bacterium]